MKDSTLIVGIPTDQVWSICTQFSHADTYLWVALTVKNAHPDSASTGREIIHALQTWFEQGRSFAEAAEYFSSYAVNPQCEIALWYSSQERSLFLVSNASAGVKRQGTYFQIATASGEKQCVQGSLHSNDILLLGTSKFTHDVLPQFISNSDEIGLAQRYTSDQESIGDPALCGVLVTITPLVPEKDLNLENDRILPPITAATRTVPRRIAVPTLPVWLHISFQRKKLFVAIVALLLGISSLVALQRFILVARERRIESVTAPLATRLDTITSSNESRMDKEREMAALLSDTAQAQKNNSQDPAISAKLDQFLARLQTLYQEIAKRKELAHLSVFYDFRLIAADFVGSQVQYDVPGKLAVFLDTARGKILSLSLEKKQPQDLSLNADIGKILSLSVVDRKAYLLGTTGIYEVSLPLDTQGKVVASASASWQNPKLIGSFAKNLYVFDPEARQILRYDRSDLAASPSAWLRGKEGVELDSLSSLSIDGDIWMGSTQGKIYKFTRGERSSFEYTDVVSPPDSSINIYTTDFLPNIYVLEPRSGRIIIFSKSGAYLSSVVSPELEAATSLIVDEEGKKAYVLAGSLVYEVEL